MIHIKTTGRIRPLLVMLAACATLISGCHKSDNEPIKIGVLHSLTGTMASSEKPVVDATLLAIEEINARGGLLGRQLVPIIADGQSDPSVFASEAERLIRDEKVAVIFGCWTSSSRKVVKPIVEKYKHLLFYPVQFEGMEQSPHIVYTGTVPSQQIIPAIGWVSAHLGKRLYLVGSDYIFPRIVNWLIRKQAALLGMQIVGESYQPLGSSDFSTDIAAIARLKPDAVINTINGDSNIAFFRAMYEAGLRADATPVMSFSIGESELATMPAKYTLGHYAAASYFQSIDTDENRAFIKAFKARFGKQAVLGDAMEAAYFGVNVWADGVTNTGTTDIPVILSSIGVQSYAAPEGVISMGLSSQHTWRRMRIGRVTKQRQFEIVWQSHDLFRPNPYPLKILRNDAQAIKDGLKEQWELIQTDPTSEAP